MNMNYTKEELKILAEGDKYYTVQNYFQREEYEYGWGQSYIIKVPIKDKQGNVLQYIIAERNDTWIDREIGSPRSVDFWEIPNTAIRTWLLKDFEIIQVVGLSNYNHQDQKALNLLKKVTCEKLGIPLEKNRQCDLDFCHNIKSLKERINDSYFKILTLFDELTKRNQIVDVIYSMKNLNRNLLLSLLKQPRYKIKQYFENNNSIKLSENQYVVLLVVRDKLLKLMDEQIIDTLNKKYKGIYWNNQEFWHKFHKNMDDVKTLILRNCFIYDSKRNEILYNNEKIRNYTRLAYYYKMNDPKFKIYFNSYKHNNQIKFLDNE